MENKNLRKIKVYSILLTILTIKFIQVELFGITAQFNSHFNAYWIISYAMYTPFVGYFDNALKQSLNMMAFASYAIAIIIGLLLYKFQFKRYNQKEFKNFRIALIVNAIAVALLTVIGFLGSMKVLGGEDASGPIESSGTAGVALVYLAFIPFVIVILILIITAYICMYNYILKNHN